MSAARWQGHRTRVVARMLLAVLLGSLVGSVAGPVLPTAQGTSAGGSGSGGGSGGAATAGTSGASGASGTSGMSGRSGTSGTSPQPDPPAGAPGRDTPGGPATPSPGTPPDDDATLRDAPPMSSRARAPTPSADNDLDGLVDGTSGFVPALLIPSSAVAVAATALPLYVLDCITRMLTRSYRDTRDLCPDVVLARAADTGTSVAPPPVEIGDVDIFVDRRSEGDVFFVVPRVPAQRPVATIALLAVVVTGAAVIYQLGRRHGRREGPPAPPGNTP